MEGEEDPVTTDGTESAPSRITELVVAVQDAARRLCARVQDGFEEQQYAFVPAAEQVALDVRRHPLVLVTPVLRTAAGLALLLLGPRLLPVAWFAVVTVAWAQIRLSSGLRRSAIVGAVAAAGAVLLLSRDGWRPDLLLVLLLLGWLAEDVADWYSDRLVVTNKRIYRRHGVITRRSPSISLMAIAYIDAAVPPLGRLLRYGTLRLDSVAQRDAPLSRFDQIPDVVGVSHEILRLRAAAMPSGPPVAY